MEAKVDQDYNIRLYENGKEVLWRRAVLTFDDVMSVIISPEARDCCVPDMDKVFYLASLMGNKCKLLKDVKDPVPHVQSGIEISVREKRKLRKEKKKEIKKQIKEAVDKTKHARDKAKIARDKK